MDLGHVRLLKEESCGVRAVVVVVVGGVPDAPTRHRVECTRARVVWSPHVYTEATATNYGMRADDGWRVEGGEGRYEDGRMLGCWWDAADS